MILERLISMENKDHMSFTGGSIHFLFLVSTVTQQLLLSVCCLFVCNWFLNSGQNSYSPNLCLGKTIISLAINVVVWFVSLCHGQYSLTWTSTSSNLTSSTLSFILFFIRPFCIVQINTFLGDQFFLLTLYMACTCYFLRLTFNALDNLLLI